MTVEKPRYFTWTRLFTGKPVVRAYVRDRVTGAVVVACEHEHRSRWRDGVYFNAGFYAERCAEKLLRRFLKAKAVK